MPMIRLSRLSPWLLVIATSACVPMPRQLYIPEGSGGQLRYSPCASKDVPDSIEFHADGIAIETKVATVTDGRHYVEMRFNVRGAKPVSLQDNRIRFVWASGRPDSEVVVSHLHLTDNPMLREHRRAVQGPLERSRNHWIREFIAPPPDGDFRLVMPSFSVDGSSVTFAAIQYRKGPFAVIAPVNC
jgi:hypothetical protein